MRSLLVALLPLLHLASAKLPSAPISQLRQSSSPSTLAKRDVNPSLLYPTHNLSVPVDHFHNESKYEPHSDATFPLRYWFDATYYKPGGPVIVLESGETSAVGRLPFLQKGIVYQLAKATGGLGVILEHRYYGESIPTPDLSTANLRFLTTDQALADTAFFARNVIFPGLEHLDLTSHATPWIAYGGSYAGAFVAFLRTRYPDVFWGAISSSGVTEAIYDYWQYYSPVAEYAPQDCVHLTQQLTHVVDEILIAHNNTPLVAELKNAFQMAGITYNNDFANAIAAGVGSWQGRNWDPALNDPTFFEYCGNLTATTIQYPSTSGLSSTVQGLLEAANSPNWGGWGWRGGHDGPPSSGSAGWNSRGPPSYGSAADKGNLTIAMLNYIGWLNSTVVQPCVRGGTTLDQCFSTHNTTFYAQDDITQTWRSWPYQYCSQYAYPPPLPPHGATNVTNALKVGLPANRLRRTRLSTAAHLPHHRPRLRVHHLRRRLQHHQPARHCRHQRLRRLRHQLSAPCHRRWRGRPLAPRHAARRRCARARQLARGARHPHPRGRASLG